MKRLSLRLKEICNLAKSSKRVADVGCDHGKVLGYLVDNCNPEYVIASDISAPSVEKAKKLLQKQNKVKFDVRVGNGFSTLTNKDKLDTIIIAGMGGLEIISILSNCNINVSKLILQPQNNVVKLRRYLNQQNYSILNDFVIREKHIFYTILEVERGNQNLTELQLKYGVNVNNPNKQLLEYLDFVKSEYEKRLNLVSELKKEELINEINEIDSVKKGKEN